MTRTLASLFVILAAASSAFAEQWRGIVPGKSTRQDVVKQFPECAGTEEICELVLEQEDVYITFAGPGDCSKAPADTVLLIDRDLNADSPIFASLGLNRKRFKTFNPVWPRELKYKAYMDEKSGFALKTIQGKVIQVVHFASFEDRGICSGFYSKPKTYVEGYFGHVWVVTSVTYANESVVEGELIRLTANYNRTVGVWLSWNTSGGRIIGRADRRHMTLDTSGLGGQTITVSVEMSDGFQHTAVGSATIKISPKP